MKKHHSVFIITLLFCFSTFAQEENTDFGFDQDIDKRKRKYSIYVLSSKGNRIKKKEAFLSKGKEITINSFDEQGDLYLKEERVYEDTLLVKTIKRYLKNNDKWVYSYSYDLKNRPLIETIYNNNKLLSSRTYQYCLDTIKIFTTQSSKLINNTETEVLGFNSDSLLSCRIVYLDLIKQPFSIETIKYNDHRQIVETRKNFNGHTYMTNYNYNFEEKTDTVLEFKDDKKLKVCVFNYKDSVFVEHCYSILGDNWLLLYKKRTEFNKNKEVRFKEVLDLSDTKDSDLHRETNGFIRKMYYDSEGLKRVEEFSNGDKKVVFLIEYS